MVTAKEMINSMYGKIAWDDVSVKPNYVRYTDADIAGAKALADCWKVSDRYSSSVSSAIQDNISYEISEGARDALCKLIDARVEELKCSHPQKIITNTENKKENNTMNNTIKNVLFLAPGYQYAMTVIANQSKELDRKKIPYNVSKKPNDLYISTDKVHVEIVYMDPIKWTSAIFQKRDAVFGKKELVDEACKQFFQYAIFRPNKSLSKYIRDLHNDYPIDEVKPRETYLPEIKNAYFNNPTTVVLWEDGTKTVVKCQEGDVYSAETGLALCIAKKAMGNMPNFNNVFRKWIPDNTVPAGVVLQVEGVDFAKAMANGDFLAKFKDGIQRAFGREEV